MKDSNVDKKTDHSTNDARLARARFAGDYSNLKTHHAHLLRVRFQRGRRFQC